jgi:hypothetical protein
VSGEENYVSNETYFANKAVGPVATSFYTPKVNPNNGTPIGLTDKGVDIPLQLPANYGEYQMSKSIYVNGSDVYVVGRVSGHYNSSLSLNSLRATVWKNGLIYAQYGTPRNVQGIDYYNTSANSMFIENGDVYVVGSDNNKPTIWKNGVATILPSSNQFGSNPEAKYIYVKGSNVCVTGLLENGNHAIWVNGVLKTLPINPSKINGVVIDNNNTMWAVGEVSANGSTRAVTWHYSFIDGTFNNFYLNVLSPDFYSSASSVTFDKLNGVVHVAINHQRYSYESIKGTVRNFTDITKSTVLASNGRVNSITSLNGNIYVIGVKSNVVTLWSNGVASTFNGFLGNGDFRNIFAVK